MILASLATILSVLFAFCVSYHIQEKELQKAIDEKWAELIRLQRKSNQLQDELRREMRHRETPREWPLIAGAATNVAGNIAILPAMGSLSLALTAGMR